jgi:class 3 adenylate cyclase
MSASAPEMVVVLMSNLVGLTTMADRVGPETAEELRTAYFGLLRGALEGTRGREVKNLDDGLMVVFLGAAHSPPCAAA